MDGSPSSFNVDPRETEVLARLFADDGSIPNNTTLPLLIYRGVFDLSALDARGASVVREVFSACDWRGSWVNGIYPFRHYHSNAHEVLGCVSGSASVELGGSGGITETITAGDVVVIPAGVGHKNCGSSSDFTVVGAYPPGQSPDTLRGDPSDRPRALENISRVPRPATDPVFGEKGPLLEHWTG